MAVVRSSRDAVEDDRWDRESSRIVLLPPFDERALRGLDEFSHCLVVYLLDRAEWDPSRVLRRPRGNPLWPEVGVFAQRNKDRPNRIGVTICRVAAIEGAVLEVAGLDAVDGTPVLDIKPHIVELGPRGEVGQPLWATELMRDYW